MKIRHTIPLITALIFLFSVMPYNCMAADSSICTDNGFVISDTPVSESEQIEREPETEQKETGSMQEILALTDESTAETVVGVARTYPGGTPAAINGRLSVKGTKLVNKDGNVFQMKGISLASVNFDHWYRYANADAMKELRDKWGCNTIRIPLYTCGKGNNGYCSVSEAEKQELLDRIKTVVDQCSSLGLYAIIDWHVLAEGDPNTYISQSEKFHNTLSKRYASYSNVLFEICNEPSGMSSDDTVSWRKIRTYADKIIPVIRKNSPNAVVIVGTPNASGSLWPVKTDRLRYANILYTSHVYASNDWSGQERLADVEDALKNGIPVCITEMSAGIAEDRPSSNINTAVFNKWSHLTKKYSVPVIFFALCEDDVSCAILNKGNGKYSSWNYNDLSLTGRIAFRSLKSIGFQAVTSLKLSEKEKTVPVGKSFTASLSYAPSNASMKKASWRSSNTQIVSVSQNGEIQAKQGGNATITAVAKDGSGKKASMTVRVNGWNGKKYYKNGKPLAGIHTVGKNVYCFGPDGEYWTGWRTVNGKKYYHDSKGRMVYGNKTIGKYQYFFDMKTGQMKTGWLTVSDEKTSATPTNGKTYEIVNAGGRTFAIDIYGAKTSVGANVQLYTRNGTKAQYFKLISEGNGYFAIVSQLGTCLDIKGSSKKNGANIQTGRRNGSASQKFKFIPNGDGTYRIQNALSGLVLDVEAGRLQNWTNIQQYTWNKTNAQKWVLVDLSAKKRYYYDKNGHKLYGKQTINGKKYTFDAKTGQLKTE